MKKVNKIDTNFEHSEKYNVENIPAVFESVSKEALDIADEECERIYEEGKTSGEINANMVRTMLINATKIYSQCYVTLKNNFLDLKSFLRNIRTSEVATIESELLELEKIAIDSEVSFREYVKIANAMNEEISSTTIELNEERINEYRDRLLKLKGEKNE